MSTKATIDIENGFEYRAHTVPPRETHAKWEVGDVVTDADGIRWRITAISGRGAVQLDRTSNPNHASRWTTTLSKLPRKAAS